MARLMLATFTASFVGAALPGALFWGVLAARERLAAGGWTRTPPRLSRTWERKPTYRAIFQCWRKGHVEKTVQLINMTHCARWCGWWKR